MPELRKDPTSNRWVVISTERAKRPGDFSLPPVEKRGGFCPFCTGNEKTTPPEVFSIRDSGNADEPGWRVRVVPNKFPAISNDGMPTDISGGLFQAKVGSGAHEVIVETTDHDLTIADLDANAFKDVVTTYVERLKTLKADPRIQYTFVFRNSGLLAGASLEHPHTQIIALPMTPLYIQDELTHAENHAKKTGNCIFCDMIEAEIKTGTRVIAQENGFVALAPFAPRFPFETWIMPVAHSSHFETLEGKTLSDYSAFMKKILSAIKSVLSDPPYNFMLHNSPAKTGNLLHYHWHLEIAPCLTNIAGFERGTGYYINPTPPEEAAKLLREALK